MLKKFIVISILASNILPACAYQVQSYTPISPLQPVQTLKPLEVAQPIDTQNMPEQYETYPKITELEGILFRKTYENQNIYNRLNRIENKVFRRTFPNLALADRMDNIMNNVDPGIAYNINPNDLGKIESKILGRTYAGEDIDSRITRLEKEMLGAMQAGNLKQRYEVVRSASRHYNTFPMQQQKTVYTPYYNNMPRRNFLGTLFDFVAGGFGAGQITGYTPSLYDQFNNYANGSGVEDYYMGNRGGYYTNRNMGNGSTVRILD